MIFEPIFTIFAVLGTGYLAKITHSLKQKQERYFLDYAVNFALPCLIFVSIYQLKFDTNILYITLLGGISTMLSGIFAYFVAKMLKFSYTTTASVFILAGFGNTLFVGMPIITAILGQEYLGKIILYDAFTGGAVLSIIAPFVLKDSKNRNFLKTTKKIIAFPPFLAIVLGFLLKPFTIPEFIFSPLNLLGNSATPTALFAIGLGLSFKAIKSSLKSTPLVIFFKMIFAPFLLFLAYKILGVRVDGDAILGIFQSAMPPMTLAAAFVMKANYDSNLAVSSVAFGLLFCLVSIPFINFLLI